MLDEPKPACIVDGEPWWNFLYSYHWEGSDYSFSICARSREEADARLKKLPLARYQGQQHGNDIPAYPGTGLFVRLSCWLRNIAQWGQAQ